MHKKAFWVLLALAAISFAGQLLLYPHLPRYVPIHWNFMGEIDRFGPRSSGLGLALFPLAGTLLLYFLPFLDPKRHNYPKHAKAYTIFSAALVFVMGGINWAFTLYALGLRLPISAITVALIGILLMIIGNYMPQLRPNYFVGVRSPWAIAHKTVWRKTHRLSGILFVFAGFCFVLAAILHGTLPFWLAAALIALVVVFPFIYSFVLFIQFTKQEEPHVKN